MPAKRSSEWPQTAAFPAKPRGIRAKKTPPKRGREYSEAEYGAKSTMTAILGRLATYSGKPIDFDDALNSDISLMPRNFSMDADPPVMPNAEGEYPIAMPGVTKTV